MILRLAFIFLFLGAVSAQADVKRVVETMATSDSVTSVGVPSTQTIYTKSFSLANQPIGPVGVMYKATSSGTVNLKIEALQSYSRPATEGASDSTYVAWELVESALSDQAWHAATLDTLIMPYGVFKITGGSGNASGTSIQIKVGKQ